MTHYRLTDGMPSAIILARNSRTSSLDELKTYGGNNIFLNHGNEFQIRLFNPLKEKIGAQISINGKKSNDLLILNPGQDVVIDRFMEEKRRMIFETYQYDDNNPAAKNAVVNNGDIEISFYKEFIPITYQHTTINTPYYNYGDQFYTNTAIEGGMGNVELPNQQLNTKCSSNFRSTNLKTKETDNSKNLKETGIVSKGSESKQNFESVQIQFEIFPFYSVSYKLKPISEKNSYPTEVRNYCPSCGYRLRNDKWVFCPKCGEKI